MTQRSPAAPRKASNEQEAYSTLAMQIVEAASRSDVSIGELAKLAEQDAGFAARLLHLVNSPVNGVARRVADIRHATSLLGVSVLKNVALALCVADLAPSGPEGDALLSIGFRRACAGRRIAELTGFPAPGEAFTTCLLLEVGILQIAAEDLVAAAKVAAQPASSRPTVERALGHTPHPLRGAALSRAWHLPEPVAYAIARHHDPEAPADPLARIAWAAEHVSAVFEGGPGSQLQAVAVRALEALGLPTLAARAMLAELPSLVEEAGTAFQRKLTNEVALERVLADASARLVQLSEQFQELVRTMDRLIDEKEHLAQELRESKARFDRFNLIDGLTGVWNRRALADALRRDVARARRGKRPLAFVMVDVDHLRQVNDAHGPAAGDAVLAAVAKTLMGNIRKGDVIARFGGEEFVAVLADTPAAGAAVVAERMRAAIQAGSHPSKEGAFQVTASLGVVDLGDGEEPDVAFARLEAALASAKARGRNVVVVA